MRRVNDESKRPKIWRRASFLILYGFLAVLLLTLLVLRLGNPQWHKYVYIFQTYVWPKHHMGKIDPPSNFTGVWTRWHRNGMKQYEGTYRDGKRDGPWILWWWDGTRGHYGISTPDHHIAWRDNGTKHFEWELENGVNHGWQREWNSNGGLMSERQCEHGKWEGVSRYWHPNGQKASECTYKDGRVHGKFATWNKDGQIIEIKHYEHGNLIRTEKRSAQPANPADREGAAADA